MTKPTHITVCKAVLTLVENPEAFDEYKGIFGSLHLGIKQQPSSLWMGYIKSASGSMLRTLGPSCGCRPSPEEAAKQLELQVEAFSRQLASLLSGSEVSPGPTT